MQELGQLLLDSCLEAAKVVGWICFSTLDVRRDFTPDPLFFMV